MRKSHHGSPLTPQAVKGAALVAAMGAFALTAVPGCGSSDNTTASPEGGAGVGGVGSNLGGNTSASGGKGGVVGAGGKAAGGGGGTGGTTASGGNAGAGGGSAGGSESGGTNGSTGGTGAGGTTTSALCGDGHRDPGEQCDDGNKLDQDSCTSTCLDNAGCLTCIANNCPFNATTHPSCSSFTDQASKDACYSVLACAQQTGCFLTGGPIYCYCGPPGTADCKNGNGVGACKAVIDAAFKAAPGTLTVTDANAIVSNLTVASIPAGAALRVLTCEYSSCGDPARGDGNWECAPDHATGAGGAGSGGTGSGGSGGTGSGGALSDGGAGNGGAGNGGTGSGGALSDGGAGNGGAGNGGAGNGGTGSGGALSDGGAGNGGSGNGGATSDGGAGNGGAVSAGGATGAGGSLAAGWADCSSATSCGEDGVGAGVHAPPCTPQGDTCIACEASNCPHNTTTHPYCQDFAAPADQALCQAVLDCTRATGCIGIGATGCFCGPGVGAVACKGNPPGSTGAHGACYTEIKNAFAAISPTGDSATIYNNLTVVSNPGGAALSLDTCDYNNCGDVTGTNECIPYCQ